MKFMKNKFLTKSTINEDLSLGKYIDIRFKEKPQDLGVSRLILKITRYIFGSEKLANKERRDISFSILNAIEPFVCELKFLSHLYNCLEDTNTINIKSLVNHCHSSPYVINYLHRAAQKLFSYDKFIEANYLYEEIIVCSDSANVDITSAHLYKAIIAFQLDLLDISELNYMKALTEQSSINNTYWNGTDQCDEIVVLSPPGIGDILIAQKHVANLKQYAKKVSCATLEKIIPFLELSDLYDQYYTYDPTTISTLLKSNLKIKVVNQLHLFGVNNFLMNLKPSPAFLKTSSRVDYFWSQKIQSGDKKVIGLCWQGKKVSPNHPGRSFSLQDLEPILTLDDLNFISLQHGFGSEQLMQSSFIKKFVPVTPLIEEKRDFINTASIVKCCDLVITCDTGIAQLSSGLGVRTIVACKTNPSVWWKHQSGQSLMHESATVWEKKNDEEWVDLFRRIAVELKAFF